ncbi:uncharacterized protein [Panulirus ornatus]|uniref:uncharacterized protein n=1 Tax=Panulirus ornatus TaxID=150431 RepID=UPI003A8A3570
MKVPLLLLLAGCFCVPTSCGSIWDDILRFNFTPNQFQANKGNANPGYDHITPAPARRDYTHHQHDHGRTNHHQHDHGRTNHHQHDHGRTNHHQHDHGRTNHHQHDHSRTNHHHLHQHGHVPARVPLKPTPARSPPHPPPPRVNSSPRVQSEPRRNASQGSHYVFNATSPQSLGCPMLYTLVGDRCIAFFTVARVPWSAAREFCHGIFGDLITFKNAHQYIDLLNYLQSSDLDTDLWIGGHTDSEEYSEWLWVDNTPMPKGSPYWAIRLDEAASRSRYVTHKSVVYTQAPYPSRAFQVNRCAAMTPKYFYYLTDEWCSLWKSPVCVLREDAEVVMVRGSEDTYPGIFIPREVTPSLLVTTRVSDGSTTRSSAGGWPGPSTDEEGEENESEESSSEEEEEEEEEGSGSMGQDAAMTDFKDDPYRLFIDQE